MDIITLLIQLVSGALGGNIAGSMLKNMSLGTLGNTIAGIVGGGLGGQILEYAFHASCRRRRSAGLAGNSDANRRRRRRRRRSDGHCRGDTRRDGEVSDAQRHAARRSRRLREENSSPNINRRAV